MPAQGGAAEEVAASDHNETNPVWAKDGGSLIFSDAADYAHAHDSDAMHRLDLKTRQMSTIPGSAHLFSPRWSPDGRWLVGMTADLSFRLKLYDFSTQKWQDFVETRTSYPSWSADSKCVYFSNDSTENIPVYRVCLADRKPQLLADLAAVGSLAAGPFGWWIGLAPDGSILALRDISNQEIYALDVKYP